MGVKPMSQEIPKPKRWWPICCKCGRVVDRVSPLPLTGDPRRDATIRDYEVECHGEVEHGFIGIWAAQEIALVGDRLWPAFKQYERR